MPPRCRKCLLIKDPELRDTYCWHIQLNAAIIHDLGRLVIYSHPELGLAATTGRGEAVVIPGAPVLPQIYPALTKGSPYDLGILAF